MIAAGTEMIDAVRKWVIRFIVYSSESMVTKTTMTPPEIVDIPTVIKTKSSCLVIFPRYGRINRGASTWPKIIFAVELNPIGPPTFSGFLKRVEIALMITGKIFQCQKIADKADDFFVNNYTAIYAKNFWFNYDEKLVNSVFKIMQKDSKFKALMVQKISFMEVKVAHLNDYSIKRDSLINLIKSNKK